MIRVLFIFLITTNSLGGILDLSQGETDEVYSEIILHAKKMAEHCPEKDCLIIGIGRSPTPIIEALNLFQKTNHIQIPLSSFRYNNLSPRSEDKLSDEEVKVLFEHISSFLDEKIEDTSIKNIVVLDYSRSGSSVFSFAQYLNEYLSLKEKSFEYKFAILHNRMNLPLINANSKEYGFSKSMILPLRVDSNPLFELFKNADFEQVSSFGKFNLRENAPLRIESTEKREFFLKTLQEYTSDHFKKQGCVQLSKSI